ncbi:hypothetical protein QCA50_009023 [Cerrena zonata]|uniref:Fungal-type protein kinase domain-containing protein n=1 Tax=Cerrena zonata TaxID=2478898 RepID=A0AAW0GCE2_9APHY
MVFMSLELLLCQVQQEAVPRLYRHDLESFCWVFFWICHCYDNGQCTPRYPCTEWINVTPAQCNNAKSSVLQKNIKSTKSYALYRLTLLELMIYWVQFHNDMEFMKSRKSTMNMEGVDTGKPRRIDMSHLVDKVERTFEEPSDIEVLRNILARLPLSMTVDMQWAYEDGRNY